MVVQYGYLYRGLSHKEQHALPWALAEGKGALGNGRLILIGCQEVVQARVTQLLQEPLARGGQRVGGVELRTEGAVSHM